MGIVAVIRYFKQRRHVEVYLEPRPRSELSCGEPQYRKGECTRPDCTAGTIAAWALSMFQRIIERSTAVPSRYETS